MTADRRPVRTLLAVPAHRASMVAKAAASDADAVYLDLEDAVPADEKHAALEGALDALQSLDFGPKRVAVRLNASEASSFAAEVAALSGIARLDALIVPKAERSADVTTLAGRLRAGQGARPEPVAIDLLVESAAGIVAVEALAAADPLVAALLLGAGDLAASLGARTVAIGQSPPTYRHQPADGPAAPLDLFAYPMMRLLLAARAFGLLAIDGPSPDHKNDRMTAAAAEKAAAMGFDGKQVIHPRQIAPTRAAFIPSPAEVESARRIVRAMAEGAAAGRGAVVFDGRMIDAANLRMARRILALAGEGA